MNTKKNAMKNATRFPYYNKTVKIDGTIAKEQLLQILDELDRDSSSSEEWRIDLSGLSDQEYAEFDCMMIQVIAQRAQHRGRGYAVGMGQTNLSFI